MPLASWTRISASSAGSVFGCFPVSNVQYEGAKVVERYTAAANSRLTFAFGDMVIGLICADLGPLSFVGLFGGERGLLLSVDSLGVMAEIEVVEQIVRMPRCWGLSVPVRFFMLSASFLQQSCNFTSMSDYITRSSLALYFTL